MISGLPKIVVKDDGLRYVGLSVAVVLFVVGFAFAKRCVDFVEPELQKVADSAVDFEHRISDQVQHVAARATDVADSAVGVTQAVAHHVADTAVGASQVVVGASRSIDAARDVARSTFGKGLVHSPSFKPFRSSSTNRVGGSG
mmetsp:Transcript_11869/g.29811  ORF Transcript_11869/g.29811 Transcript_11869/m.29811 type:complete len:143 (-) Transcript_11869:257-685(-)